MHKLVPSHSERLRCLMNERYGDAGYCSDCSEYGYSKEFAKQMHSVSAELMRKRARPEEETLYRDLLRQPKRQLKKKTDLELQAAMRLKNAIKLQRIYEKLLQLFMDNNQEPLPFYKLIIDPNNFDKSVDNYFQLIALVHQNRIVVGDGHDGHPHIRVLCEEGDRAMLEGGGSLCQSVMLLDMEKWQKYQTIYGMQQPLLQVSDSDDDDD